MGRSSALAGGEFGDYAEFPPISLWSAPIYNRWNSDLTLSLNLITEEIWT